MSGLDEVNQILSAADLSNPGTAFEAIINTRAFIERSVGVNATIVCFMERQPNPGLLASAFVEYLFAREDESFTLKKCALEFMLLWVRGSPVTELDSQISLLEKIIPGIQSILAAEPPFALHQKIISMLFHKCNTHVVDAGFAVGSPLESKEFLTVSSGATRAGYMYTLRGRLQIIMAFLSSPKRPATAKRPLSVPLLEDDNDLVRSIKKVASQTITGPLELKKIHDWLSSVPVIECSNRVPRVPVRVLNCLDTITLDEQPQDPEVCLQIAIMCIIAQKDEQFDFKPHIDKFAQLCGINSTALLNTLKRSYDPVSPTESEATHAPAEVEELFPAQQILQPFDLEPVEELEDPSVELEPMDELLNELAGQDMAEWNDGDEMAQWRIARRCVGDFMDRLNPDSFSIM